MQNQDLKIAALNDSPSLDIARTVPSERTSSGVDVMQQFKANMKQVVMLQKKLNFMVREVNALVKPKR